MKIMPSQQQRIIARIRAAGKRGLSYLDLNLLCVSTCAHRRLSSDEHPERWLKPGEKLKRVRVDGRVRLVIERTA